MKIKEKRIIVKATGEEKIIRYDKNGNEIYYKDSYRETWKTYNEFNLVTNIREKDSNGEYWWRHEYDENGNETYYEDHLGNFRKATYNEEGIIIYSRDKDEEYFYEYDDKGCIIYQKDKDCESGEETEYWYDYTNEDELTVYADANKTEIIRKYICGLPIYYKDEGTETWITRDKSGREISEHTKDSEGNKFWSKTQYECDENDNIISFKYNDSDGTFNEVTYNDKGQATHYKFNKSEIWNEYEYDENGKVLYWREDTWCYSEGTEEPRKSYNETWYKYDSEGNEIWYKYKSNTGTEREETTTYIYYPE